MKKLITSFSFGSLLLLPVMASAQIVDSGNAGPFEDLLINIVTFINDILIPFIIAIGFLVFVWGIFLYFIMGGADEEKRQKGRSLMIWATIGFVAIIIFFGVINLLTQSIGLQGETLRNIPEVPEP
ncbi:hypothetical protein KC851_00310 [Candidatus Kaiserbacteria bacterium]|nr:hypothetical protein [Candidatus Kaiserbacteria bacterium]